MKKGSQKKNKYAHLNEAQGEFDFHSLNPFLIKEDLRNLTLTKLDEFKKEDLQVVRLIVGKGLHSQNGPVIKPLVLELLKELKLKGQIRDFNFDSAFGTGPNQGALIVKL